MPCANPGADTLTHCSADLLVTLQARRAAGASINDDKVHVQRCKLPEVEGGGQFTDFGLNIKVKAKLWCILNTCMCLHCPPLSAAGKGNLGARNQE